MTDSASPTVNEPVLSVVILTWNSCALLDACLAALPAATASLASETIVVDNGSTDGTVEWLARRTDLITILNPSNRGVAPARNQGIRAARGAFLALLDDDTVAAPGALATLVAHLKATPEVGLAGPKLVGPDGNLQYSCRRFPTLLDKLLRRLPQRFGGAVADDVELRWWDHASVRAVDYVIGACQVIRRTALDEVGLLDERIFYGPEDVDLCLRLQRAGWRVDYVPQAVIMHLERRVTRKLLSALTARHLQGLGYYFWKHRYLLTRPEGSAARRAA
jgi:GT2 family glycosyltransferase